MRRTVQILLLFALLPMFGNAREETLEERKQRITRKYLRERSNIFQSDLVVPEVVADDAQVTDSEQFKDVEIEFKPQEVAAMPPPPQTRRMPPQKNPNWLLDDLETDSVDPYASTDLSQEEDYWSMWGGESADQGRETSRKPSYDPYVRQNRDSSGIFDKRSGLGVERRDIFGQRESQAVIPSIGSQAKKVYGSTPDEGLLQSPFVRRDQSDPESLRQRTPMYTPYKSPYQIDPAERRKQWELSVPQNEYIKPDTYQQWKSRNKAWDPTSDDAYLDELMKKNRR